MFTEKQQFRQAWLWLVLVVVLVAVGASTFAMTVSYTNDEVGAWILVVAGLSVLLIATLFAFFMFGAMITEERDDGLLIRFRPVWERLIPYHDIQSAAVREYSPLREYGGWGYRIGRNGRAYSVSGRYGVQLVLTDDKALLIGSQEAEALASALSQRLS